MMCCVERCGFVRICVRRLTDLNGADGGDWMEISRQQGNMEWSVLHGNNIDAFA